MVNDARKRNMKGIESHEQRGHEGNGFIKEAARQAVHGNNGEGGNENHAKAFPRNEAGIQRIGGDGDHVLMQGHGDRKSVV